MSRILRIAMIVAAAVAAGSGIMFHGGPASGAVAHGRPVVRYGAVSVNPVAAKHTTTTRFAYIPDSGTSGDTWGLDSYTDVMTVTRGAQVAVSHCGGGARCYAYSFAFTDTGTTQTQAGQVSPGCNGTNCTLAEDVTESVAFSGGAKGTFYSSYKRFYTQYVPVSWDANGTATSLPDSPAWAEQGTPGAHLAGGTLTTWGWRYKAVAGTDQQCPSYSGAWADLITGTAGNILAPDAADCAAQS
jgi:hypothetical protein